MSYPKDIMEEVLYSQEEIVSKAKELAKRINEDYDYINYWKKEAQKYYESNYGSREDFIKAFGRNYLD